VQLIWFYSKLGNADNIASKTFTAEQWCQAYSISEVVIIRLSSDHKKGLFINDI